MMMMLPSKRRCIISFSSRFIYYLWSLLLLLQVLTLSPPLAMGILPEIRWVDILNTKRYARDSEKYDDNNNDHGTTNRLRGRTSHKDADQDEIDDVQELYIEQSLDHFRLEDDRTFSQRYFYTDRFVQEGGSSSTTGSAGAVKQEYAFLCCGGEGPSLEKSVLVDSVHCTGDMIELAKILYTQHNASVHLYALEHRYYGKSYPTFVENNTTASSSSSSSSSPVSNENLVYLSSRQALADLANFVTTMNDAKRCSCCCSSSSSSSDMMRRWVTFGGSYPGMIAAWARLRFPHLIHAAVSNSAPIQPKLDFAAYNNHVAWALQYEKIGGSQQCLDIVVAGHAELSQKVEDPTLYEDIARDFKLCNATSLRNPDNLQLFLGDGVYRIGAQSNDPSCNAGPRCNIARKCQALVDKVNKDSLSPYEALSWIIHQADADSEQCTVLDWQGTLDYISDPQEGQQGGLRSWLWQTCTEFGFYQTCDEDSDCPFGRGWHILPQDMGICDFAFGVRPGRVDRAVQETLSYYGGWDLRATRVLSVNGNVDPWSELALVPPDGGVNSSRIGNHYDDDPDRPTWMVQGASHHFWTHPIKATDSPEVVEARRFIQKTVIDWLLVDDGESDNGRDSIQLLGDTSNPGTVKTKYR